MDRGPNLIKRCHTHSTLVLFDGSPQQSRMCGKVTIRNEWRHAVDFDHELKRVPLMGFA